MQKLIWAVLIVCLVFSCTIEKRVFLPGYSIHWKKKIALAKNERGAPSTEEIKKSNEKQEEAKAKPSGQVYPSADSIIKQESVLTYATPKGFNNKEVQQAKHVIKRSVKEFGYRAAADEPEQEITTKPAKDWQALIAILLGIMCGLCLYLPGLILFAVLFRGRKSELAVSNRKPEDQKRLGGYS